MKKKLKCLPAPKVGDVCVVNDLPDAVIYKIKHLDKNVASLTYESEGQELGGGYMHVSCLYVPTKKQLRSSK